MEVRKKIFMSCVATIMFVALLPATQVWGASEGNITPVDVYYLTQSIDDSLVSMYGLTYEFKRKKLSSNIRPRNSYQQLLSLADEFNFLHPGAIDESKLGEARRIDLVNVKPSDLFAVFSLIKEYLVSAGHYTEYHGERTPKVPSDVNYMLRQISHHHLEIAKQRNIQTNWSTPAQVYDAIMNDILPVVHQLVEDAGTLHTHYEFPIQPVRGIKPLNITRLLQHIYANLSGHYVKKINYEPLILIKANDCDEVTPGDSFDLIKAISAELIAMAGKTTLDSETAAKYGRWKQSKSEIVTGDVFRLLQYVYILSEKMLESKTQ